MATVDCATSLKVYRRSQKLMGNQFELSIVCDDDQKAETALNAAIEEIQRIEKLLTTFSENSQTAAINNNAGKQPVAVDQEVFDLILRSRKISQLTEGSFDITYGSIDKRFWNFDQDMKSLPDAEQAKKSVRLINYRNVILDHEHKTVFLKNEGMRIGFGGIGKGYAADRAKAVLRNMGIESGVVNASGDLVAWGSQVDGQPWTIGIADPKYKGGAFSYMNISNKAVATSGNYEKFAVINGKRYSHTINPRTGFPVSGIKSVTIIAPIGELADAMATPVMVMGVRAGLNLVNQVKGLACIVIDESDRVFTSDNIKIVK
jgi:FAD:protein FMN transferase